MKPLIISGMLLAVFICIVLFIPESFTVISAFFIPLAYSVFISFFKKTPLNFIVPMIYVIVFYCLSMYAEPDMFSGWLSKIGLGVVYIFVHWMVLEFTYPKEKVVDGGYTGYTNEFLLWLKEKVKNNRMKH